MNYPKESVNCEDIFIIDGFELTCGKKNIYGDWVLCPPCKKLNKKFLKSYSNNHKEVTRKNG